MRIFGHGFSLGIIFKMSDENDDCTVPGPSTATQRQPPPRSNQLGFLINLNDTDSYLNDLFVDIDSHSADIISGICCVKIKSLMKKKSAAHICIIEDLTIGLKTVILSGDENTKTLTREIIKRIISGANDVEFCSIKVLFDPSFAPLSDYDWDDSLERSKAFITIENAKRRLAYLPPVVKDFYEEDPHVTSLTDKEVEDFKLHKNIKVQFLDENNVTPIPKPTLEIVHAFSNYPEIMRVIKYQIKTPLPLQSQAWPIIMSGYDLIVFAQNEAGKMLTFLLPAFIHINIQHTPRIKRKGPSLLVFVPDRKSALQIENEITKYNSCGFKIMSIYDVEKFELQAEYLKYGIDIVIAIPFCLQYFVNNRGIDLSDVTLLIFTEADQMLDLKSDFQIYTLLLNVRQDRQTIIMSATWLPRVVQFAKQWTNDPILLIVGLLDFKMFDNIPEDFLFMDEVQKRIWFNNILLNCENDEIVIFVNRKSTAHELVSYLNTIRYTVNSIDKARERMAMKSSRGSYNVYILVANCSTKTNVLINKDYSSFAMHYTVFNEITEHVCKGDRLESTNRSVCTKMSFMIERDISKIKDWLEFLKKENQNIPLELQSAVDYYEATGENRDISSLFRPPNK